MEVVPINTAADLQPLGAAEHASLPPSHLTALDGLRGFACLCVVAYHCYNYGPSIPWPTLTVGMRRWTPTHFLAYGYMGVEMFFVLSGFCLAYPFFRHSSAGFDWKRYFLHRVRRIYPAYWGALLLLSMLALIISHLHIPTLTNSNVLVMPSFGRSLLSIINPETYLNGSFWTLKVELRWYILLPFLLILHRKIKSLGLVAVAVAVSLLYAETLGQNPNSRMSTLLSSLPIFLPLFVGGIWVAQIKAANTPDRIEQFLIRSARWGIVVALGLVALWAPVHSEEGIHFNRVVPGGLLAFFLLLLSLYDPVFRKLLTWRPLVSIGLFSYSLYLIHQPIIMLFSAVTRPLHWSGAIQFFFFQVAVFLFCIMFGFLFFQLAEKPFIRHTRSTER